MKDPLLKVDHLSVSYKSGNSSPTAVRDVSFEINRGEVLALMGETGSGKSTISRAILGTLSTNAKLENGSTITFFRKSSEGSHAVRNAASLPQYPMLALNPTMSCGKQIEEVCAGTRKERRDRVLDLLEECRLPAQEVYDAFPHQLSLGQVQRVCLAITLAIKADLIIADEPFSSLDRENREVLTVLMKRFVHDRQIAVLLITHDVSLVNKLADRWIYLHTGKQIDGDITPLRDSTERHRIVNDLMMAEQVLKERRTAQQSKGAVVLSCQKLCYTYRSRRDFWFFKRGAKPAIRGVDFSICEAQIVGLSGPSGCGKSTLALILGGVLNDFEGQRVLHGDDRRSYFSAVQYIMQDSASSLPPLVSVREMLKDAILAFADGYLERSDIQARIIDILNDLGLPHEYQKKWGYQLSGGEKQRVALARALINRPRLLILDESLSALDRQTQVDVLDLLLDRVSSQKLALVLVTHDDVLLKKYADVILTLDGSGMPVRIA